MSILIYAFSNRWGTNVSRRTLSELQSLLSPILLARRSLGEGGLKEGIGVDFIPIYFHPQSFFKKFITGSSYELIIGLGDFYGHITQPRLETVARNNYLNKPIYPFSPITLELSLPPLDHLNTHIFKISENMGTYNCNWIAYSIEKYLRDRSLSTSQLFFHLPKKMSASVAASQIFDMLTNNQLLK